MPDGPDFSNAFFQNVLQLRLAALEGGVNSSIIGYFSTSSIVRLRCEFELTDFLDALYRLSFAITTRLLVR
jgi:hypothetical protein